MTKLIFTILTIIPISIIVSVFLSILLDETGRSPLEPPLSHVVPSSMGVDVDVLSEATDEGQRPSIFTLEPLVKDAIVDHLIRVYGIKFTIIDIHLKHIYEDLYEGHIEIKEVSGFPNQWMFWLEDYGGAIFIDKILERVDLDGPEFPFDLGK